MKKGKQSSLRLTTFIVLFPLLSLLLYGGSSHLFFIYTQHKIIKQEINKSKKNLMDAEQASLKEKVENLTQFIRYYDGRSSEKIKDDVKNIINVTVDVADNLYQQYKGHLAEDALKTMIKDALGQIKFEGNIGYLFLLNLKGDVILHIDKKMIGTNIMNIRDVNGKYIVKEFTKIIEEKNEGFVDYYWYIVGENKKTMHYKISFVKKLAAYDWYVGAGEYLKYMTKFVREDILEYIEANASFKDGYFFISDSMNQIVFHPDVNNRMAQSPQKAVDLSHYRIEGLYKDDNHIAYTLYVAQYDWYVTAVRELTKIKTSINFKKKENETKRVEAIKTNLYLMLFSWTISLLLSLYLSLLINRMLKNYEVELHDTNEKLVFQSRQALIGELFPMIAHQWRQPINKIASILALLRFDLFEKRMDYQEVDKRCHEIENSIEFMSETIDDFRTFYQPKESSEKVNLKVLINKSLDFMEASLRKKNILIIKDLEEISFKLYSNELLQVMINLIKNAIDAISAEKGEITIKLYQELTGAVVISVEDNGSGIGNGSLAKIFEPYYTTKEDSMGLGLYMTKMIIEKHMKGSLEAQKLPQGLKFIIKL